jgi:hypothetical protein
MASLEVEYIMRGCRSLAITLRYPRSPPRSTHVLRRIIWRPADECNLAPGALAGVELVLNIEHGVATANALLSLTVFALGVEELLAENVKVSLLGSLLNDNLFPVVADLVDDPFDILSELQLVECADALGRYGDTEVGLVHATLEARGWHGGWVVAVASIRAKVD